MDGPLWMISGIFNAFHSRSFKGLIGVGQFFYTLVVCILYSRQTLRISGLSRAIRTDLSRIIPQFVWSRFVI
jgi:uncharacterized membrane protein (DUF485 family)